MRMDTKITIRIGARGYESDDEQRHHAAFPASAGREARDD